MSIENLILASGSPRRRELLENAGFKFEVLITDADESISSKDPEEAVQEIAKRKAEAAASILTKPEAIIIAADTIVYIPGKILGKPNNKAEAISMLKSLNGIWHEVYTGVAIAAIINKVPQYKFAVCKTRVKFKQLTNAQITAYADTQEPLDKAGAYAIQGKGGALVEALEGDYDNVVGLPVRSVIEMLDGGWVWR